MGFVVIPGSKNAEHIKDNMDIFDFALTDEEMEQIAKLDKNERYYHRTDEQLVQFANWKPEFENNMEKIVCEHRIKMRKRVKGCKSLFQNEYIPCGCGESISIILIEISII